MTLCRRGRSVFRRTLVRGLVVMSVIERDLPDVGARLYRYASQSSHIGNAARNWRRTAARDLSRRADERFETTMMQMLRPIAPSKLAGLKCRVRLKPRSH